MPDHEVGHRGGAGEVFAFVVGIEFIRERASFSNTLWQNMRHIRCHKLPEAMSFLVRQVPHPKRPRTYRARRGGAERLAIFAQAAVSIAGENRRRASRSEAGGCQDNGGNQRSDPQPPAAMATSSHNEIMLGGKPRAAGR